MIWIRFGVASRELGLVLVRLQLFFSCRIHPRYPSCFPPFLNPSFVDLYAQYNHHMNRPKSVLNMLYDGLMNSEI